MAPEIEANRAFSVLKQLTTALSAVEGRALFVSGVWEHKKSDYAQLLQEWPVTTVGFHRARGPGFWRFLGLFIGRYFILRLEDPAFLVNVFRIPGGDRSMAAWSVDQADAADFQAALLAQSLESGGCNTTLYGDLMAFVPNLFWFDLLEDIGFDEPYLWLHCGERVPRALKQIIADNRLEPYLNPEIWPK